MKFKLVKLSRFSGHKSSLYSEVIDGENETLLDKFVRNNLSNHSKEIEQIFATLNAICKRVGAKDIYFRRKKKIKRVMAAKRFMTILRQNCVCIAFVMAVLRWFLVMAAKRM